MQSRKAFLKTLSTAAIGIACMGPGLLLSGCSAMVKVTPIRRDENFFISLTEIKPDAVLLVSHPDLPEQIYIVNEGEKYYALSTICTHRGCGIRPAGKAFVCPCHGSEFAFDGTVLKGPARESLKRYSIEKQPDQLVIKIQG
ncbi:MAG: cytochrome b6-f complex iron-sulfur subunit [Sphingobacteriales bacterium]|jgi:cytochrome b6-f complex iron-sulfur subunit